MSTPIGNRTAGTRALGTDRWEPDWAPLRPRPHGPGDRVFLRDRRRSDDAHGPHHEHDGYGSYDDTEDTDDGYWGDEDDDALTLLRHRVAD